MKNIFSAINRGTISLTLNPLESLLGNLSPLTYFQHFPLPQITLNNNKTNLKMKHSHKNYNNCNKICVKMKPSKISFKY